MHMNSHTATSRTVTPLSHTSDEYAPDNSRSSREVAAEFNLRHFQRVPISHGKTAAVNAIFNETVSVIKIHQNGQHRRIHRHPEDNGSKSSKSTHQQGSSDDNKRLDYCYWAHGNFFNDRNFLKKILFTDEAAFTTNGVVSPQNCRYWDRDKPSRVINCKDQYFQKVNVWCGILGDRIIGPVFFNNSLNAERLVNFFDGEFWNAICDRR
ncbi:hypothetical protein ILUMI_25314, partial [Ignelater luminosus]